MKSVEEAVAAAAAIGDADVGLSASLSKDMCDTSRSVSGLNVNSFVLENELDRASYTCEVSKKPHVRTQKTPVSSLGGH